MKSIFLCENLTYPSWVYPEKSIRFLEENAGLSRTVYNKAALEQNPEMFKDTEFVFSTWSMPQLSEKEIKNLLPSLKAVFYAAGSVRNFAKPFIRCGIKVFSAWTANAVPVAEYTVAQIILANKGFYRTSAVMKSGEVSKATNVSDTYNGNFDENIGIIGAGTIGKLVIKMLKDYRLNIFVFDPFLSDENAEKLGVKKCSLEEVFTNCRVVSNHLANNEQTKGILNGELFRRLPYNATFINTGRGAQVVEDDLVALLERRPDVVAILDVTAPEPPVTGHKFYTLPNCILTPHIAGSKGKEVNRMAEYMVEEYLKFIEGEPPLYNITEKMLETMS